MHCFITGITGFIGSKVAEKLLKKNHTVSGLTRSHKKAEDLRRLGIDPVVGDIRKPTRWIPFVQDVDAIVHTATIPVPSRPNRRYLKELASAQETVVTSLVESASSCKVFVYTSGITVYGSGSKTKTEESKTDPVDLAKPYMVGEEILKRAVYKQEFPAMILRPAGVYGDGGIFAKYWTDPIAKGKRSFFPGNGKQVKSFVAVEDCAQAYVQCIENPMPGEIFNIADDEPVAIKTLIRYLANEMKSPKPLGIPTPIFRMVGGKILAEMLLTDMIIDNSKMKEKLGMQLKYPTYREGVKELATKLN